MAKFFDRSTLRKAVVTDAGFLRAPATLTRTGVFHYAPPGEKPFSVLRLPEEVFSDASMASFELLPAVIDHPTVNDGVVDASNAKTLTVGSMGAPFQNGHLLEGTILVTDAEAIKTINGGKCQVSLGYFADKEPAPEGATYRDPVSGRDEPYDFVQRNIRGNHVAIVDCARAGEMARLHLDAACEVDPVDSEAKVVPTLSQVTNTLSPQGTSKMNIAITIDGYTFQADSALATAIAKERKIAADLIAASEENSKASKASFDKLQATCDSLKGDNAKLTEKVAKLEDPKAIAAAVATRVAVEALAKTHGLTADGKDLITVKREVCAKLNPALDATKMVSDSYADAMFDLLSAKPAETVADKVEALIVDSTLPVAVASAASMQKKFNDAVYGQNAGDSKK